VVGSVQWQRNCSHFLSESQSCWGGCKQWATHSWRSTDGPPELFQFYWSSCSDEHWVQCEFITVFHERYMLLWFASILIWSVLELVELVPGPPVPGRGRGGGGGCSLFVISLQCPQHCPLMLFGHVIRELACMHSSEHMFSCLLPTLHSWEHMKHYSLFATIWFEMIHSSSIHCKRGILLPWLSLAVNSNISSKCQALSLLWGVEVLRIDSKHKIMQPPLFLFCIIALNLRPNYEFALFFFLLCIIAPIFPKCLYQCLYFAYTNQGNGAKDFGNSRGNGESWKGWIPIVRSQSRGNHAIIS
jgi:hypothetical protein